MQAQRLILLLFMAVVAMNAIAVNASNLRSGRFFHKITRFFSGKQTCWDRRPALNYAWQKANTWYHELKLDYATKNSKILNSEKLKWGLKN